MVEATSHRGIQKAGFRLPSCAVIDAKHCHSCSSLLKRHGIVLYLSTEIVQWHKSTFKLVTTVDRSC